MKNSHYEGQQQMQGHTDRTNTNLHTVWLSNSRRVQESRYKDVGISSAYRDH